MFSISQKEGLCDEPRREPPRTVSDAQGEQVANRTLESPAHARPPWSARGISEASWPGRTTISRLGRAFPLQAHRSKTFKLPPGSLLTEKLRDIVGLYLNTRDHALVLCVGEERQIQALDRTRPLLPLQIRKNIKKVLDSPSA